MAGLSQQKTSLKAIQQKSLGVRKRGVGLPPRQSRPHSEPCPTIARRAAVGIQLCQPRVQKTAMAPFGLRDWTRPIPSPRSPKILPFLHCTRGKNHAPCSKTIRKEERELSAYDAGRWICPTVSHPLLPGARVLLECTEYTFSPAPQESLEAQTCSADSCPRANIDQCGRRILYLHACMRP